MTSQTVDPLKNVVLCLSGGMDSTTLLLRCLRRGSFVHGVSFDYGQRHVLELERLQANLEYLREKGCDRFEWRRIDLQSITQLLDSALTRTDIDMPLGHYEHESMKSTFVPNRNAIFCSIAYGFALTLAERTGDRVGLGLGVHAGDHAIYPDCRPEFYSQIADAFRIGNWNSERVVFEMPFVDWDKARILRDAHALCSQLGLDFDRVMRNTCTGYLPDERGRSNGLTGADVERVLAFHQCGWVDPIDYQFPWPEIVRRAIEMEATFREKRVVAIPPPSSQFPAIGV